MVGVEGGGNDPGGVREGRKAAAAGPSILLVDFVMECTGAALWGCLSHFRGQRSRMKC